MIPAAGSCPDDEILSERAYRLPQGTVGIGYHDTVEPKVRYVEIGVMGFLELCIYISIEKKSKCFYFIVNVIVCP